MGEMRGRDFLSANDFSKEELREILAEALRLKRELKEGKEHCLLKGRTLGMVFQKPSTRTRVSFEVAMWQLGGQALFLSAQDLQIGRGEPLKDTARTLSRYLDGIMIRTFAHSEAEELAAFASVPVINGLTDLLHPCQAMADMLTLLEHFGRLEGLQLAYVGDGNNVVHSLMLAATRLGLQMAVATPPGYEPDQEIVDAARINSARAGTNLLVTNDPELAVMGAQAVYTDVWASMGQEAEHAERCALFQPYQLNSRLLAQAVPGALVLHCLPAHRGEEITEQVLEGPQSVVFDQAENRLHVQKAILAALL
ncbi:MAG: Ornithine carbamoyltransferase [Syntrophomonadaceae bacterium]|nr:Ornithine carbamoyltransferase [Bacillota bacterium]